MSKFAISIKVFHLATKMSNESTKNRGVAFSFQIIGRQSPPRSARRARKIGIHGIEFSYNSVEARQEAWSELDGGVGCCRRA